MDTRLLKMFCAVARTGRVAAAAANLHLTPSAVSHGLKSLESDLGCRLFDRTAQRLVLNQAGEELLARVTGPLAALEAAAVSLQRLGKWGQSRLRVGMAVSACQHFLPRIIRELRNAHPGLEMQVSSGDMPEMTERVRSNQVDLSLGVAADVHPGLDSRPVFRDELMFVFAPTHPWAKGGPITADDLRGQLLILYQRSSLTMRLLEAYFRAQDITPRVAMEIGSLEAIKELVRLELGISVLAPWAGGNELARGTLAMRPLGRQPLWRKWVVVFPAAKRLTLVEEHFIRLCRNHAASLALDRRDLPNHPVRRQ